MKRYEYRCERCMTIEERWTFGTVKPQNFIFCFKCGSEASRNQGPNSHKQVYKKKSR